MRTLITSNHPIAVERLRYLLVVKHLVEQASGFRWRITSFIRDSPSHYNGSALDIAPQIKAEDQELYAFYNKSDPVLHRRTILLNHLASAVNNIPIGFKYSVGIFVETDHLHLQLFSKRDSFPYHIGATWGRLKPLYKDSGVRQSARDDVVDLLNCEE